MEGSGPRRGRSCFCLSKGRAEPDEAEELAALLGKQTCANKCAPGLGLGRSERSHRLLAVQEVVDHTAQARVARVLGHHQLPRNDQLEEERSQLPLP